jgi:uncharacterized protein
MSRSETGGFPFTSLLQRSLNARKFCLQKHHQKDIYHTMDNICKKEMVLREILSDAGSIVLGYSGGSDSALLAVVAADTLGSRSHCVLFSFEAFPPSEEQDATEMAERLGLSLTTVKKDISSDTAFLANTPDRCYFCKRWMFIKLLEKASALTVSCVADGSNLDDLKDVRPGMRAARELGVKSPLIAAGFSKSDVRELSRRLNLPTWNKPSFSCLATRIPHGVTIETTILKRIEKAEAFLGALGLSPVRVRHYGNTAKIEVTLDQMQRLALNEINNLVQCEFARIGYPHTEIGIFTLKPDQ